MMLTSEASRRLDRYLDDLRATMSGVDRDDIVEIEQDIREHIDAELGERPAPVSADELDAVLSRLGSPERWLAGPPADQGRGARDWPAYASLVLLVLGFALPYLIPLSWIVARWALARLEQRSEPSGARRWLIYPPLAVCSFAIALVTLFWPFGLFGELGTMTARRYGAATVAAAGLGVYWIVLGLLAAFNERAVRAIFHPFIDGFRRQHAWWLVGAGAFMALGATVAFFGVR